jgi:hypothetical protein
MTCKERKIIYENNKLSLDGFNIPINRNGRILENGKTQFTFDIVNEGKQPITVIPVNTIH